MEINFDVLIKLIDKNNDNIIQKEEINEFLKTQDKSIFTNYANSLTDDINVNDFEIGLRKERNDEKNKGLEQLNFKDKEAEKEYKNKNTEYLQYRETYFYYGYKFKSDEDFNKEFQKYIELLKKENYNETPETIKYHSKVFEERKASAEIMFSRLNTGEFPRVGTDFQFTEIDEDCDLSSYEDVFKFIVFNENTFAKLPPKKLPKGYNPKEILEKGKSIGMCIDDVHKMGYTGKGMSIAVIDSGTMCNNGKQHNALKFKEYNVAATDKNNSYLNHFHGLATSYIAQQIAPDADLYYFAQNNGNPHGDNLVQNLQAIIDKNKILPDDKKIRIVSMSFDAHTGDKKVLEKIKELESQGVWVFSSDRQTKEEINNKEFFPNFWDKFGYLEKKNPSGDIDDFNNYQVCNSGFETDANGKKIEPLYVSSGDRTVPDPDNPDAFRHDSLASASWAIPVVAGYYTLACQADSKMTPDKFLELANKTARTIQSTMPKRDKNCIETGRTQETKEIKIIDIKALLQAIEQEKNNQ